MRMGLGRLAFPASFALWLGLCGFGFWVLLRYQTTAGKAGEPSARWPADSPLRPDPKHATLVLFAHPRCACTRASLDSLAWTVARSGAGLKAYVVFYKPTGYPDSWLKTDLWDSAAAIPGVRTLADPGGAEARRFRAGTSGQVVVYAPSGALLYDGGITGGRGHFGDNAGRDAVVSVLAQSAARGAASRVFGCALLGADAGRGTGGTSWTQRERVQTIARL